MIRDDQVNKAIKLFESKREASTGAVTFTGAARPLDREDPQARGFTSPRVDPENLVAHVIPEKPRSARRE